MLRRNTLWISAVSRFTQQSREEGGIKKTRLLLLPLPLLLPVWQTCL